MNATTFSEEEINQAWSALLGEFEERDHYVKYPHEDFLEDIGVLETEFEKCVIRRNENQGQPYPVDNNQDGFRFDSPENLQVWFSTPQQLAELIVRGRIMNYAIHNTEENTACIHIEGKCLEYRDVYNLKLLLNQIQIIVDVENETNYGGNEGYFIDAFKDGVLLTFMTNPEEDEEESENASYNIFGDVFDPLYSVTRASIFICKPKPDE